MNEFVGDIDLVYALDLLQRMSDVHVDGVPVSQLTLLGRYVAWQFFAQSLLQECKEFSRHKGKGMPESKRVRATIFQYAAPAVAIVLTMLASLRLRLGRPRVLVFSADKCSDGTRDHDFRLDGVYRVLRATHTPFVELIHTFYGGSFFRNILRRGRPVLYLEALPSRKAAAKEIAVDGLDAFSPEEQAFVRAVARKYIGLIPHVEGRIRRLARLLNTGKVRSVIAIDDFRYCFEVLAAAELATVPSALVQHGHFTKYHVGALFQKGMSGTIAQPTRYLLWSEYWKDELVRLGSVFAPKTFSVAGSATEGTTSSPPREPHEGTNVLIPYEIDGYKEELRAYVTALRASPNVHVLFKLRADLPAERQCAEYGIDPNDSRIESGTGSDLLARADVVAGTYSTFLYLAVEALRPVALLKTRSDFGEGMLVNGLADPLASESGFSDVLQAIAHTPEETLVKRRALLLARAPAAFDAACAAFLAASSALPHSPRVS